MSEISTRDGSSPEESNKEKVRIFEQKKHKFFVKLGLSVREALKMHKESELWDWDEKRNRSWKNVSKHCLVETARALIFADKLGFSKERKRDLMIAAALHDFFKRKEIDIIEEKNMTWNSILEAEEKASETLDEALEKKNFNKDVIKIIVSKSFDPSVKKQILEKENLSQEDITCLVLMYIDSYTDGDEWVKPSEIGEDGEAVNALDRREQGSQERYGLLSEDSKKYFNGESVFSIHRRTGHQIEKILVDILQQRGNGNIAPEDLPYFIDQEIKAEIESQT